MICYDKASLPMAQQPNEFLIFVTFWEERTGGIPAELVFNSQLMTHPNLNRLNQRGVRYMTLRRRTCAMSEAN